MNNKANQKLDTISLETEQNDIYLIKNMNFSYFEPIFIELGLFGL